MVHIVDTSVFITLERRKLPVEALTASTGTEGLVLASITASELLVGLHRATTLRYRLDRQTIIDYIFDTFPILPFDLLAARTHALRLVDLKSSGQMIGSHDLIIAATALARGYDVLTENERDFGRVPGLSIRQPIWPS